MKMLSRKREAQPSPAEERIAELQRAEASREASTEPVEETTSPESQTQGPPPGPSSEDTLPSALSGWFGQVEEVRTEKNTTDAHARESQAEAETALAVLDEVYGYDPRSGSRAL